MKICFLSGLKEVVGQGELQMDFSGRLSELLEKLCDLHGQDLRDLLLGPDESGGRNPQVKILVDERDIRQEDPELVGNETIFLFLPLAGG